MSAYETLTFPLLVEDEVDRAIIYEVGALIMQASVADLMMGEVLVRFASEGSEHNRFVEPLVAGMDFKVKLAIARVQASVFSEEDRKAFVKICDRLQEVYQRRNDVAHCFPNGARGAAHLFQSTKRDGSGSLAKPKQLTAQQIRGWSYEFPIRLQELSEIQDRYGYPSLEQTEAE